MEPKEILQKLHRKYSKVETVALQKEIIDDLGRVLATREFQIGELKSLVAEHEDTISKLNKQLTKVATPRDTPGDKMKKLRADRSQSIAKMRIWREKYLSLLASTNPITKPLKR